MHHGLRTIRQGLMVARDLANRELRAMQELLDTAPMVVKSRVIVDQPYYIESSDSIDDGIDALHTVLAEYDEMKKRCDLCNRWQLYWRVLTCKVILGKADVNDAKHAAFFAILGEEPPTETEMQKEISALTTELTNMEAAEEEHGPLRSINIDRKQD